LLAMLLARPAPEWAIPHFLAGADAPAALIAALHDATASVRPALLIGRARAALSVDATAALAASRVPILYRAASRLAAPATRGRRGHRRVLGEVCDGSSDGRVGPGGPRLATRICLSLGVNRTGSSPCPRRRRRGRLLRVAAWRALNAPDRSCRSIGIPSVIPLAQLVSGAEVKTAGCV